jgi:hypothetical protein
MKSYLQHQLLTLLFLGLTSCAPWNAETRKVGTSGLQNVADSAYIESHRKIGPNYGCSFIEFDGKGGFLDYGQYQHALAKLDELKARSDVLLVIYCHGWNNNPQSGDVIRFVGFLRRLADSGSIRAKHLRVEGVYLAWRGSQYLPVASRDDQAEERALEPDFGGPLVDTRWHNSGSVGLLLSPAKYLSYWAIKDRAEFHVSRVPLSRAVFGLAFNLKSPSESRKGRQHRVFILGHSFGALLLEQAIGQASVGLLMSEWTRDKSDARWPFDLIVFLNSAAPSLYAKQLGEFLQYDHRRTAKPRIVSITSTGDWATGIFHPLGNAFKRFAPDLQRQYYPNGKYKEPVPAWRYYDRTPGHNSDLINHVVTEDHNADKPNLVDDDAVFSWNLRETNPANVFFTRSRLDGKLQAWEIMDLTKNAERGSEKYAQKKYASNYWIATVPPDIVKDHTDIWSAPCMEMLAGVYRTVEQLGQQPAPAQPKASMQAD